MSKLANEQGFTLVELLVVASIIALLAILLIPSLSRKNNINVKLRNETEILKKIDVLRQLSRQSGGDQFFSRESWPKGSTWQPHYPAATIEPRFHADGSADGGELRINESKSIIISWIDGHATIFNRQ
jgi:prepilin-type N-terminal cleavage/methylation domain-containing protein